MLPAYVALCAVVALIDLINLITAPAGQRRRWALLLALVAVATIGGVLIIASGGLD